MTQARFAGRGQNPGRAGRDDLGNSQGQGCGRGTGYMSKPKTTKRTTSLIAVLQMPQI